MANIVIHPLAGDELTDIVIAPANGDFGVMIKGPDAAWRTPEQVKLIAEGMLKAVETASRL